MASVQIHICDAELLPQHVIQKHKALSSLEKLRHFAALRIQRLWRGYVVRKEISHWNRAATVLQKYIRGFLLRWHLPQIVRDLRDWYRLYNYHKMATRIQARWKGYYMRVHVINARELIAQRRAIVAANNRVKELMTEAFESMEKNRMNQLEQEAQQWVLYILFKLHHLLRTYTTEGIYSIHGSKRLSAIEQLLKVIPLKNYMDELKKIYYKEIRKQCPHPCYIFKEKRLQRIEDDYRNRNRDHEIRPQAQRPFKEIHSKPFVLSKKVPEKKYERSVFAADMFSGKKVIPKPDKNKFMSDKDFDLHVLSKKGRRKMKPSPYYLDFWERTCDIHSIPD